jgi:hypothetical protein
MKVEALGRIYRPEGVLYASDKKNAFGVWTSKYVIIFRQFKVHFNTYA